MSVPIGVWIASATQSTRLCVTWMGLMVNGPILKRSPALISLSSASSSSAVLFQLALDVGEREFGGVDGNVQLRQQPGQRADVVFVSVRQHHGAHVLPVLEQIAEVGDDDVHAQQLGFGEHEPGIDDDDVVTPANGHAVHAEFAESAQRYNL